MADISNYSTNKAGLVVVKVDLWVQFFLLNSDTSGLMVRSSPSQRISVRSDWKPKPIFCVGAAVKVSFAAEKICICCIFFLIKLKIKQSVSSTILFKEALLTRMSNNSNIGGKWSVCVPPPACLSPSISFLFLFPSSILSLLLLESLVASQCQSCFSVSPLALFCRQVFRFMFPSFSLGCFVVHHLAASLSLFCMCRT